jgi:hypothetical protein
MSEHRRPPRSCGGWVKRKAGDSGLRTPTHGEPASGVPGKAASSTRRRIAAALVLVAGYASLSLFDFEHLLGGFGSRVPATPYSGDVGAAVWYLAWLPFALGHGLNPFVSHFQFAPAGFNLLSNTGDLFPAFVLSPVTVLFGPVSAFDVAVVAAPVISAGALYFVARRLGCSAPAAFVAGALYGYSPYLMHEDPLGHLNLTWMFFPPLAYYLLDRILCVQAGSPYREGAALGTLVVAQFFTSTEILLDCALVAVPLVCLFALRRVHEVRQRRAYVLRALGAAFLVTIPLLAYPLWVDVAGPYHILATRARSGSISLLSPLWPSAPAGSGFAKRVDSGFLGAGAVLLASLALVVSRHVHNVAHLVAGSVLSYLLALGQSVRIIGAHIVSHAWIWSMLDRVRLFRAIEDYRFAALYVMFVALLVALAIDHAPAVWASAVRRRAGNHAAHRWRRATTICGLAAVALVLPLAADSAPLAVQRVSLPSFVAHIPAHGRAPTVAEYPGPSIIDGAPLIWQAMSGMRFKLTGGYAFVPAVRAEARARGSGLSASAFNILFLAAALGTLTPDLSSGARAAVRTALADSDVSDVVVALRGHDGRVLAHTMSNVLGRPSVRSSTYWVWSALRRMTDRARGSVGASTRLGGFDGLRAHDVYDPGPHQHRDKAGVGRRSSSIDLPVLALRGSVMGAAS